MLGFRFMGALRLSLACHTLCQGMLEDRTYIDTLLIVVPQHIASHELP